ncbi:hypothetical protein HYDPIDRAFT_116298, partial [Hydnomerulius pinastri MD-312]
PATEDPQDHATIPSLPAHWTVSGCQPGHPLSYLRSAAWAFLCLASVSKPDLNDHWISKQTDELWQKQSDVIVSRLGNSNTAAGLILATTAVFMTTVPPMQTWNYLEQAPNFLCYLALCHALMSIWFGSWLMIVYQTTTRKWAVEVLMKNRLRLTCSLILMSLPTSNFLFSAFCLINAIAVVTASSSQISFKVAVVIELAIWSIGSLMAVFCLSSPTFWTGTILGFPGKGAGQEADLTSPVA